MEYDSSQICLVMTARRIDNISHSPNQTAFFSNNANLLLFFLLLFNFSSQHTRPHPNVLGGDHFPQSRRPFVHWPLPNAHKTQAVKAAPPKHAPLILLLSNPHTTALSFNFSSAHTKLVTTFFSPLLLLLLQLIALQCLSLLAAKLIFLSFFLLLFFLIFFLYRQRVVVAWYGGCWVFCRAAQIHPCPGMGEECLFWSSGNI